MQDSEAPLQAKYETEAVSWAEARQWLISGYGQIEDLVDGRPPSSSFLACCLPFSPVSDFVFFLFLSCADYFPGYSTAANQVIEAHREAQRQDVVGHLAVLFGKVFEAGSPSGSRPGR